VTSVRHSMSQRLVFESGDDGLLDAAHACVLAVGVRRTTFSDVGRRAGVSRMTLYRRYPDLEALLSALITREFGRAVEEAHAAAGDRPTCRERVVGMTAGAAERLAADPLFRRLLDVDPELLLPYVTAASAACSGWRSPAWPRTSPPGPATARSGPATPP
jgi:AcrR family transcriptional regulator